MAFAAVSEVTMAAEAVFARDNGSAVAAFDPESSVVPRAAAMVLGLALGAVATFAAAV
jgi:hypothetical protein